MRITVHLPWPPAELSQNARDHWAVKAKYAKKYRGDAFILAMQQVGIINVEIPAKVKIDMRFYPPSLRHFDSSNLVGRMKAGIDGVFDWLHWDDFIGRITTGELCEVRKGGAVEFSIEWED